MEPSMLDQWSSSPTKNTENILNKKVKITPVVKLNKKNKSWLTLIKILKIHKGQLPKCTSGAVNKQGGVVIFTWGAMFLLSLRFQIKSWLWTVRQVPVQTKDRAIVFKHCTDKRCLHWLQEVQVFLVCPVMFSFVAFVAVVGDVRVHATGKFSLLGSAAWKWIYGWGFFLLLLQFSSDFWGFANGFMPRYIELVV